MALLLLHFQQLHSPNVDQSAFQTANTACRKAGLLQWHQRCKFIPLANKFYTVGHVPPEKYLENKSQSFFWLEILLLPSPKINNFALVHIYCTQYLFQYFPCF